MLQNPEHAAHFSEKRRQEKKHWLISKCGKFTLEEQGGKHTLTGTLAQERLTAPALHQTQCGASVAGACKISNSTVGEYVRRAKAAGISWPLGDLDEQELNAKSFPEKKKIESQARPMPDWEKIQREKRQKGVTL